VNRVRAVAIVNRHARRVRGRLLRELESALPGAVRFTDSLDHAREVVRAEIERNADLVVFGGGDGTVVMGLALLAEACRGTGVVEPAIGVLRLGAGNAIADAVGASDDPAADLRRLARGEGVRTVRPMIEVLGVRAPFVGTGVDAQLIEDERAVGRVVDRLPGARRFVGGTARYALSIALRSVPRFATGSRAHATVTNLGAAAIEMDRDGETGRTVAREHQLWTGACTLVAAATIPFFGFGLKMFAFAEHRPDRFHLRCGDVGLLEILRRTPDAFRGTYFSRHVTDFLCDRVAIELDHEVAIEAGGELLGRHRRIEVAIGSPVTLVALPRVER
jgi:diacylglycerol kinase family enzyme